MQRWVSVPLVGAALALVINLAARVTEDWSTEAVRREISHPDPVLVS
ncbi:hypothetical protein ACQP2E_23655 [Actinoplanes sp. CA-015351]